MAYDNPEIGKRLKEIRKALNLTQRQIGAKIGMSGANWSGLENGGTVMERTLKALSDTFSVNREFVLHGTEPIFIEKTKLQKEIEEELGKLSPVFQGFALKMIQLMQEYDVKPEEKLGSVDGVE